jgi:uncharacterized membrane protein YdjX (TVP38/TMEM64 family)
MGTLKPEMSMATDPVPSGSEKTSWTRWLLAGGVVLTIVAFYAFGLQRYLSWETVRANLDTWKAQVRENLLLYALVYFLVYLGVTALSLPVALPLSLLGGALFGRWLGTAIVSLAATLGATGAFLLSRYLFRDAVQRRFGPRLAAINRGVEKEGAYYLFTLRLVPAVPFFLINLGMGLTPMRVWTFLLVSWVGMLPGTFIYLYTGEALGTLESPSGIISVEVMVPLILLGIFPLAVRKLIQTWGGRRSGGRDNTPRL